MEQSFVLKVALSLVALSFVVKMVVKKLNSWIHESKLGEKKKNLPPGDMGLPFVGNMLPFLRAFKSSNPESFLDSFYTRYGKTGIYKAYMFGGPVIMVSTPDTCRKVLNDDECFTPGWPVSTVELIGKKSFISIPDEDHKRLRRLTAAPINGHEALSNYIEYIENITVENLEKWTKMGNIEFLTLLRKMTFRIIMHIFLSSENEDVMQSLEKQYTALNYGVRAQAINLPGFAYHGALKARKKLVAVLQSVIDRRRAQKKERLAIKAKRDMMDALLEVEENGKFLTDEEIIDLLVMYLNAGHESSGHMTMWTAVLLQEHPEYLKRAKAEQEEIVKNRPAGQKGLNLKEIRQMKYLSQVIDETLRWASFSFVVFRRARKDVNLNGYLIPKGWKVLVWFRHIHTSADVWDEPYKYNPDRWDNLTPKAGAFVPFGMGTRLCPGNDLAKLEISIFMHYFLLNYRLDRVDPNSTVQCLPHRRPADNCLAKIRRL